MKSTRPSPEMLNAFVDGEFCAEERLACLKEVADDEDSVREVCELLQVKEMVSLAYAHVPAPPHRTACRPAAGQRRWQPAVAAAVLTIAVAGTTVTWMGGSRMGAGPATHASVEPMPGPERYANRILVHLTTADPERIDNILDEVELLMKTSVDQGVPLQIQVVAHGAGLALMRSDISPFPRRVAMLSARYPEGLSFTVCLNTIERLRREENIHVRLLPGARVIDSGVVEVIRRQSEGWTYIQV